MILCQGSLICCRLKVEGVTQSVSGQRSSGAFIYFSWALVKLVKFVTLSGDNDEVSFSKYLRSSFP